jgi:alkanesulfonate monooxygenase SsuD/methylene tetrahydromethanopterin reductase-like flavin-dependent oxidoreductase (luciferase family)
LPIRNPALTAKLCSTIDVISGGRFELGIGAGWKQDEWLAYGYGFPPIGERLDALGDNLEVITRMLAPGHATFQGKHAQVTGAINVPKGIQRHIPIIVGGNGPVRTAGYAVKFGDELNMVFQSPAQCAQKMAEVRARCEKEGRDPATMRFSLYAEDELMRVAGRERADSLAAYAAIGLDRLVGFPTRWDPTTETQAAFAEDCRAAGIVLGTK